MKHTPGTKQWADAIVAAMRKRHGLKDDDALGVAVMPAEVSVDESDPLVFSARITKRVLDRDGEVVLPAGGIFTEFDASGAVFWNHDYDRPVASPVGGLAKSNDYIDAKARFMERPDGSQGEFLPEYARSFVASQAKAGKAAGVSIGFIPLEQRKPTAKDKQEYGPEVRNVITKWKMLEWSIAPVQANQDAYVTAVGKSIGSQACKALFGVEVDAPDPEGDTPAPPPPDDAHARLKARTALAAAQARHTASVARKAVEAARKARREAKAQRLRGHAEAERQMIEDAAMYAKAKLRGELWPGQFNA